MNGRNHKKEFPVLLASFLLVLALISAGQIQAEELSRVKLDPTSPQKVTLVVGKSIIIGTPEPVKRVSLVTPEIADAMVLTPRQIYLTGKGPGTTNVTIWEKDDRVSAILQVEVSPDISRFKEALYRILPEEKEVQVTATHESITLSGSVSSTTSLSQVWPWRNRIFPRRLSIYSRSAEFTR